MDENQLIINLREAVISGLAMFDISGVAVEQSYAPRAKGTDLGPAVYIHKLGDRRYGYNGRSDKWEQVESVMVHTERQIIETTYQINALVKREIRNPAQMTAPDLVNAVAEILAHDRTRLFLKLKEIGILRITDVTNPFFSDDFDQNESSPSFDVVLTHESIRRTESEILQTVDIAIHRV